MQPLVHRRRSSKRVKILAALLCVAVIATTVRVPAVHAATGINGTIAYQGKIALQSGSAIGNGTYNMRFKLFDASAGGTQLWVETWNDSTQRVTMTGGLFSVYLGTHASMSAVNFNTDSLYLQVEFDPGNDGTYEETFAPRRRFSSVPYAHNADRLDGLDGSQLLRTDAANTATGSIVFSTGGVAINARGTVSGAVISASRALTVSGSLSVDGAVTMGNYASCALIATDADGNVECGDGLMGTGSVIAVGDARYVNVSGDTMTGTLVLTPQSGLALNARGTVSGALITQNGAGSNYFMGRVGIGTNNPNSTAGVAMEVNGDIYLSSGADRTIQTELTSNSAGYDLKLTAANGAGGPDNHFDGGDVYVFGGDNSGLGIEGDVILGHTESTARGNVGVGTTAPKAKLDVLGTVSGSSIQSFGLADCDLAAQTLQWDATTGRFSCGTDSDTTYSAGQNLTLNGTSFSLNSTITGALLEFQTVSGSTVYASKSLRSSGSVVWEGSASGASLYVASSIQGAGLADCDVTSNALQWDATTGRFGCTTITGGAWSGTGALRTAFDSRYVNVSGDTMTGALTIDRASGTIGLNVIQTMSGHTVFASKALESSGTLTVEGNTVLAAGNVTIAADGATVFNENGASVDFRVESDLVSHMLWVDGSDDVVIMGSASKASSDFWVDALEGVVINDSGVATNDTRIESNNHAYAFLVDAGADRVGMFTDTPDTALDVVGTISGSVITANTLRSSGSLVWEGSASGASLYVASSIQGAGLTDCDLSASALQWDATTGRFGCTTITGGAWSGTGALRTAFDSRYVNVSGDTMTGTLVLTPQSGLALNARGTVSGALITQNGAGNNSFMGNVGIGITAPWSKFEVYDSADNSAVTARDYDGGITISNPSLAANSYSMLKFASYGAGESSDGSFIKSLSVSNNNMELAFGEYDNGGNEFERMRIDQNGNVGIGTTSPGNELAINAASGDAGLDFELADTLYWTIATDGSTADLEMTNRLSGTTALGIDVLTDNVGIGTASPKTKLEVMGTISGSLLTVNGAGSSYIRGDLAIGRSTPLGALHIDSGFGISNGIVFGDGDTFLYENSDDVLHLIAGADGTFSLDATYAVFSSVNVGIGTAAPDRHLEVSASTADGGILRLTNTDTTVAAGEGAGMIEFYNNDATVGATVAGYVKSRAVNAGSQYALDFGTANNTNATTAMTVDFDGNVGIGTTDPSSALEVVNTVTIQPSGSNVSTLRTNASNAIMDFITDRSSVLGAAFRFRDAAGNLSMSILDNGNVGIGVTAPKTKLEVLGTISGSLVTQNGAGDNYFLGNIGAGTSSPSRGLHYAAITPFLRISDTNSTTTTEATPLIEFYHGLTTSSLGHLGFNSTGDTNLEIRNALSGSMEFLTNNTQQMTILSGGNVGIGTTVPDSRVQIAGGGLCVGSNTNCNTDNNTEGVVYSSSTAMSVYDVAEMYPTKDLTLTGADIVSLDPGNGVFVRRAEPGDRRLLGVVSLEPAVVLGGFNGQQFQGEHQVAIALSGRVPVRVTLEGGPIAIGDSLTLGSQPGIARKATGGEQTIGYALEDFDGPGTGSILVFVRTGDVQPMAIGGSGAALAVTGSSIDGKALLLLDTEETDGSKDALKIVTDVGSNDNTVFRIAADGDVHTDGTYNSSGADYAEWFKSAGNARLESGALVCVDPTRPNTVKLCDRDADANVMGIVSTNPAFIGNSIGGASGIVPPGYSLIGLIGQVPAKATAEGGAIRPGDQLTSASKPGYARKAAAGESTVGVALEGLESGEGTVNVLISRRNSSLTVETVEDHVLETIAAMEIDDEVEIMIARAMGDLNVEQSIIDEVTQQVDALNVPSAVEKEVSLQIALLREELLALATAGGDDAAAAATGAVLGSDLAASTLWLASSLSVDGDARIAGDLHLDGALMTNDLFVPGILAVDGSLTSNSLTVTGDAAVHGALTLHGPVIFGSGAAIQFGSGFTMVDLVVERSLTVLGDITIDGLATFLGDVAIDGELTVARQAGHVRVPLGATGATFAFDPPFKGTPVVTASPNVPILYAVSVATSTGFTISLAVPAPSDVTFSWVALVVPKETTIPGEAPSGLVFPVDERGVPVSSSLQWNACIRGLPLFDATGIPYSCSRYHDENVWEHPDLHISFLWNDAVTPPYMQLPDGYAATVTENSASVRAAVIDVNAVQGPAAAGETDDGTVPVDDGQTLAPEEPTEIPPEEPADAAPVVPVAEETPPAPATPPADPADEVLSEDVPVEEAPPAEQAPIQQQSVPTEVETEEETEAEAEAEAAEVAEKPVAEEAEQQQSGADPEPAEGAAAEPVEEIPAAEPVEAAPATE